nr:MAG: riboflavin biosynthesis protein RibF [Epulopiscium sp. Nele67-Bin001]
MIMRTYDKRNKMHQCGVDVYIQYPFTLEFSKTDPEVFFEEILVKQLKAKVVVVGQDYHFGKEQQGNIEFMQSFANKFNVKLCAVKKVFIDGEAISSTKIRNLICEGNLQEAKELLGEDYVVSGAVVEGKKLGRQIGFPTANILAREGVLYPPNGVYATKARVNKQDYLGITNIGCNPTVGGIIKTIETNIFDFNEDIYNEHIVLTFYKFIRPEKTFKGVPELIEQITQDKQKVAQLNSIYCYV